MSGHSRNPARITDPYCYLALSVFDEVFRNIESYFNQNGTPEEIEEGKKGIRWIKRMEGNFRLLSIASGKSLDVFHQICLWKINNLKQKAYERQRISKENRKN